MKKLETTRRIVQGTVLRIYKQGFGYARLAVTDVTDHYMACLCESEYFMHAKPGDSLEVYLWVENIASYDFSTRVLGKLDPLDEKIPHILFLDHTTEITRSEERRCLHARVNMPMRFFLFDTGKIDKNFSTEEIQFYDGIILELGDREILLRSDIPLPARHFMYGHIPMGGGQMEIIGKINLIDDNGANIYRVSFPGIPEKERNVILDYIFDVYRE